MNFLKRMLCEEQGQDLVEYTLLIVAAAVTGLALIQILAPSFGSQWSATSAAVNGASATVAAAISAS